MADKLVENLYPTFPSFTLETANYLKEGNRTRKIHTKAQKKMKPGKSRLHRKETFKELSMMTYYNIYT